MVDVGESVRSELRRLPKELREGSLASGALVLAERLADAAPRDVAGIHRELRLTLVALRAAAKAQPEGADPLDELARRDAESVGSATPDGADAVDQPRAGGGRAGGASRS